MPELSPEQKENIYLASGETHPALAQATADALGVPLGPVEHKMFKNTELWMRYVDSIRKKHVFVMQSMTSWNGRSINDSFAQAGLMVDTAKRASASEITLVAPYLAYGRQDRKNLGRDPLSAAWAINALRDWGADRFVTIDAHSPQIQAAFHGPFDHMVAGGLIRDALAEEIGDNKDEYVIVSPDAGRVKASMHYADKLDVDMTFVPKLRSRTNSAEITRPKLASEVIGRTCIVIDDMIDTGGTLVTLVDSLRESGAEKVIVGATHGLFSDTALERLQASAIDKLLITDTLPQDATIEALGKRVEVLTVAPILAETIGAIATGRSVSEIFEGDNYS